MEQCLGKALAVVGRAHVVAELIESLASGRGDLRVDSIEEREGCQKVLTWAALTAGDIPLAPNRRSARNRGGRRVSQNARLLVWPEVPSIVGRAARLLAKARTARVRPSGG